MNLGSVNTYKNGLLYAAWNQDGGCFCCGLNNGFRIYNTDPLKEKERNDFADGGIGFVEMLFRCNYLALIGGGRSPKYSPTNVVIWDDLKRKPILEIDCSPDCVRAVRLRRDRIIVVLERAIHVYTLTQPPRKLRNFDTGPNVAGICALCPDSTNALLAFPGKNVGQVDIVALSNPDVDKPPLTIAAHETSISCLAINLSGSLLASTSEKGTLIRVWDTKSLQLVHELRRGTNNAIIYSVTFNRDSTMLCVASDHGTVHIFSLNATGPASLPGSRVLSAPSVPASALIAPLGKYLHSRTSFCKISLHTHVPCICTFGEPTPSGNHTVIVVCADGAYYKFAFSEKGDCLREQYARFLEMTDDGL